MRPTYAQADARRKRVELGFLGQLAKPGLSQLLVADLEFAIGAAVIPKGCHDPFHVQGSEAKLRHDAGKVLLRSKPAAFVSIRSNGRVLVI